MELKRFKFAISIHAPARGATFQSFYQYYRHIISIHAPARGATGPRFIRSKRKVFQSTLPRGERLYVLENKNAPGDISIHAPARGATENMMCGIVFAMISIHAPARGATFYRGCIPDDLEISIHAPARGATHASSSGTTCVLRFQSTLPRGERRQSDIVYKYLNNDFNPRSREGSDV